MAMSKAESRGDDGGIVGALLAYFASGLVAARHCITELKKHVFPRLDRPRTPKCDDDSDGEEDNDDDEDVGE